MIAGGALCTHGLPAHAFADEPSLADCDASSASRILHPAASGAELEARAIWLDGSRILWPGVDAGGHFRLYHSSDGGASAVAGRPVEGADSALDLAVKDGRLRTDATTETLRDVHRQQLLLVQEDRDGRVLRSTRLQSAAALDALFPSAANASLGARITAPTELSGKVAA